MSAKAMTFRPFFQGNRRGKTWKNGLVTNDHDHAGTSSSPLQLPVLSRSTLTDAPLFSQPLSLTTECGLLSQSVISLSSVPPSPMELCLRKSEDLAGPPRTGGAPSHLVLVLSS